MKTTMQEIIEGFAILTKYNGCKGEVCAEHDIIYAAPGVEQDDLDPEDIAKMEELHWHWDNDADSWAKFV
jgi:hypothetical protein